MNHLPANREPELLRQVFGELYMGQNLRSFPQTVRYFHLPEDCAYTPFCDDFGPMNLGSVFRFNSALSRELRIASRADQSVVFSVEKGRRSLSNAVFLVGAYMIIEQGKSVTDVVASFSWLEQKHVEGFRDATFIRPKFLLSIADCWRGLGEGVRLGWISSKATKAKASPMIDIDTYEHYDDVTNGDIHEVVPGKFVAFAGPVDANESDPDEPDFFRGFTPEFYLRAFEELGVTDIVQLNNSTYDTTAFTSKGITVHRLPFPDCTCPAEDIVESFLRIADGARGLVAVHCRAGLGRTGTLIARYMMRSQGFGARQAIAWLRIMRPGSVIGPQQQYLCAIEAAANDAADASAKEPESPGAQAYAKASSRWLRFQCLAPDLSDEEVEEGSQAAAPAVARTPSWKAWLLTRMPSRSGSSSRSSSSSTVVAASEPHRPASVAEAAAANKSIDHRPSSVDALDTSASLASQVRLGMAARGAARIQASRMGRTPSSGGSPEICMPQLAMPALNA